MASDSEPWMGDGHAGQQTVEVAGPNASDPIETMPYLIKFDDRIDSTGSLEGRDTAISGEHGYGTLGRGQDYWSGVGKVSIEHIGTDSMQSIDVTIDGQHVATLAPGESYPSGTSLYEETAATVPSGPITHRYQGEGGSTGDSSGTTTIGGNLPVPAILPAVGPLSSSMVTGLAAIVAAGLVLSVVM